MMNDLKSLVSKNFFYCHENGTYWMNTKKFMTGERYLFCSKPLKMLLQSAGFSFLFSAVESWYSLNKRNTPFN